MDADRYEIIVVKYGTRRTMRSEVFLNHFIYGEPDAPIEMDYYFWVVRNDHRSILIDTGFSQVGAQRRSRSFLVDPFEAFDALGVSPLSAPTVVVTHAHYDHIGNLAAFRDSRIHLSAAEFDFWAGSGRERRQYGYSAEADELDALVDAHANGRVALFQGSSTLAPGVELIEVGGHTPGQVIVKVATHDGEVLLASDALHYYEELERDMPFVFIDDLRATYRAFDLITNIAESGVGERVVAGHDPDVLRRFAGRSHPALPALSVVIGGRE
ncbi:N-acyl homoserine lactonase family protein [Lysinimonas soli]|uniref:N-acyl homoserine lactonase family protein n=1 Tax=Lysinimonas soli TaxID=1074233 RepID=A0ABW0NQ10_9MICO